MNALASPVSVPYEYAAIAGDSEWRTRFRWPVIYDDVQRALRVALESLVRGLASFDDEDARALAILGVGWTFRFGAPLIEMAMTDAAAASAGIRFASNAPELAYLRGSLDAPPPGAVPPGERTIVAPRHARLRRLARIHSWTPWTRLPAACIAPQVVAHSHNDRLVHCARASGRRIGFVHAEGQLAQAMALAPRDAGVRHAEAVAMATVSALTEAAPLNAEHRRRLGALLLPRARRDYAAAERQLAAVRCLGPLPKEIWAGSGGFWPSRVVGLEALRRGSTVVRFDHGDNRALHDVGAWLVLVDLAVGSKLVMRSEVSAERWRKQGIDRLMPDRRPALIEGAAPHTSSSRGASPATVIATRPRVLYAPSVLRGLKQTVPAALPDLVYLDWQLRLVEAIRDLPIELLCRPHPQGILGGTRHPLADLAPLRPERFEELAHQADIYLFDDPYSRVFCQALSSGKPIVWVDFGANYVAPEIRPLVERVAMVLRTAPDDRGRPTLDWAALEDCLRAPRRPDDQALAGLRGLFAR